MGGQKQPEGVKNNEVYAIWRRIKRAQFIENKFNNKSGTKVEHETQTYSLGRLTIKSQS